MMVITVDKYIMGVTNQPNPNYTHNATHPSLGRVTSPTYVEQTLTSGSAQEGLSKDISNELVSLQYILMPLTALPIEDFSKIFSNSLS